MKEEKNIIEKIQETSKVGLIVTNIIKIICIVGSVIMILVGCVSIGANDLINAGFEAASFDSSMLEDMSLLERGILRSLLDEGDIASILGAEMIVLGAILICTAITLHFVGKVFKEMRESYSPFKAAIVKNLKVVFVLVTLLALSSSLGIGLIVGISLWCVCHIFEYGCELQRQSDETL